MCGVVNEEENMARKRLDESLSPSRLDKSFGGRGTDRPNFGPLVGGPGGTVQPAPASQPAPAPAAPEATGGGGNNLADALETERAKTKTLQDALARAIDALSRARQNLAEVQMGTRNIAESIQVAKKDEDDAREAVGLQRLYT